MLNQGVVVVEGEEFLVLGIHAQSFLFAQVRQSVTPPRRSAPWLLRGALLRVLRPDARRPLSTSQTIEAVSLSTSQTRSRDRPALTRAGAVRGS